MFLVIYMFTIEKKIENEIIINKSKFITYLYKVNNIDEINNILDNLKKEYKDATHHCYSYVIGNIKRFNDDGEPSHTAGMPMLNVLENKKLDNVLAVVIRYFGGIKLGAGGLVRAYTNSVSEAVNKANIIPIIKEYKIRIEFDYNNVNNINYILKDYKITYKEFDENIIYEFMYEENNYPLDIDKYVLKKEELN